MIRPLPRCDRFPWPLACGLFVAAMAWACSLQARAASDPEAAFAREPSWVIPDVADVQARTLAWLATTAGSDSASAAAAVGRAEAAWTTGSAGRIDVLDAVMEAMACGDPRARAVREAAGGTDQPDLAWLADTATPAVVREAVTLWWARELVRHDRFDDALPLLVPLDPAAAVDPATLLFLRGACQHWLLLADEAVETLDQLLERETEIPVRYARVARLLRADMAALDRGSLDHIARRMRDVTRRLDLGRAGAMTREVQDGVIESLDALIKRLEDQQQGQQGQASAGAGGGSGQGGAGRPMEDSRIAGGRGAGDVRARDLEAGDGWGNLPPHDRERALQQIGREFPPHYREAIEQYFKRLSAGAEDR